MHYNTTEDMSGDHYSDNLRHMAEPATPDERDRAVSVSLEDYQALYLATMLREWAHYHAPGEKQASIARGYVEYINHQVRERGQKTIEIYAHTPLAAEVVIDGMYDYHEAYRQSVASDVFSTLEEVIIDLWGRQHAESVNKDAGRKEYELPPALVQVQSPDGETIEAARE